MPAPALVVDNTFLSPAVFRPLEHGADLVLHSATKYLGGHGDTVCGVVAGTKELIDPIRYELDALGAAVSPFNSWLVARGMRTLPLRMEAHSRNALRGGALPRRRGPRCGSSAIRACPDTRSTRWRRGSSRGATAG